MQKYPFLISGLVFFFACPNCLTADVEPLEYGAPFSLKSVHDKAIDVKTSVSPHWTVLCFLGTECPLTRLYGPRLEQMADECFDSEIRFVGINSNSQDSTEEICEYKIQYGINFPVIKDYGNVIADQYRVTRNPEVIVLDRTLRICYRGLIDDQYLPGITRTTPSKHYLKDAIEQLRRHQKVDVPSTEPVGCLIGRVRNGKNKDSNVTYCDQVSRVLRSHCVECHREGEIGPFALTDYDEVVGWADMILEVVDDGRMPPWHASPRHGQFRNARQVPESDKEHLRTWVASGTPYGDPKQLPEEVEFVQGWQLPRSPDLVLQMSERPFQVPAIGTVEYQYFVVNPGFAEDKWISAAQVIPGSRSVLHHSIVFIRPPDGVRFRGIGWLTGYVPGQRLPKSRPHMARFVPAGSKFVFQQHYTPTGTVEEDLTKVGLVFSQDHEVSHEIFSLVGIDQEFEIPPHASDHAVQAKVSWFPENGELLSITPHMHVRGKSFRLFAGNDKQQTILLDIPHYDFNWQHIYELSKPLSLAQIDAIEFHAVFDNSSTNLANPNPTQYVTWGDQTWEEMAVAFLEVSAPREVTYSENAKPAKRSEVARSKSEKKVTAFVSQFFDRFDRNRDDMVDQSETPLSTRAFGFRHLDDNHDNRLSRCEVRKAARKRLID